ncbi:MAG: cyclodeaminase/cyclohydrolase family protein [Candidatus Omnitrophica bacterium]|nr:cyclodeaminase/cyclohydrolase family protein [Candidatus Omnitrophota bacterium]MDD5574524.1 cyclodeaminase/cyclohydrolase family protein [Candidatus Omnitrophota bacterium]
MTYARTSVTQYLGDLSKKTPAPGGGSVAALCLACAAGLVAMVCEYTIGKETCKAFSSRARCLLKRSLKIRDEAVRLVDADIRAYLKKDRAQSIAVPARICRLSAETARMAREVAQKGNKNLRSDADLAASLAKAAVSGSRSYVRVNIRSLKNSRKYAKLLKELKTIG